MVGGGRTRASLHVTGFGSGCGCCRVGGVSSIQKKEFCIRRIFRETRILFVCFLLFHSINLFICEEFKLATSQYSHSYVLDHGEDFEVEISPPHIDCIAYSMTRDDWEIIKQITQKILKLFREVETRARRVHLCCFFLCSIVSWLSVNSRRPPTRRGRLYHQNRNTTKKAW